MNYNVLKFFSTIGIGLLLISIANGVCLNNYSCRAVHAEVYQRDQCAGIFSNPCFSKHVNANSTECCDAGNKDCRTGSDDDALFWVDCDTDARKTQGFGQAIVACSFCYINVYDSGMIVVVNQKDPTKTLAVYSCRYT